MPKEPTERRLAAIVAMDVVGYSRLMEADEDGTLARLKAVRAGIIDPTLSLHGGRLVKTAGDGLLIEFPSAVAAVECAVAIQVAVASSERDLRADERLCLRIGINLGEVIVDEEDIYGGGVNVAARLESLAEPGAILISQKVYDEVCGKMESEFEDRGEQVVKNIAKPIQTWAWVPKSDTLLLGKQDIPALPDKPSIAVLPFENLSGDPEQEFFADGMTEDIITELSRFRGLFVIARNSTFNYKGQAVDPRVVGRELGVRYVLEGSVRKAADRIRVSAQLIDAPSRNHVWAERYDRDLADIFAVQDDITRTIVSALEPELESAERLRATSSKPERLDAWGAYHRGLWHIYRFTKKDTALALKLFERAIQLDPSFAAGWSGKSFAHFSNAFIGFVGDRAAERRLALQSARRSVDLDDRDAGAHWALARAHMLEAEYDRSIPEFETAITLNPNFAHAYYQLAWALVRSGRPEDALPYIQTAERLSPHDPLRFGFNIVRAQAYYIMRDFELALEWAEKAVRQPHAHAHIEAVRVASLVQTDQIDAAKSAAKAMLAKRPDYSLSLFKDAHRYIRQEDMRLYLDALIEAGLPD